MPQLNAYYVYRLDPGHALILATPQNGGPVCQHMDDEILKFGADLVGKYGYDPAGQVPLRNEVPPGVDKRRPEGQQALPLTADQMMFLYAQIALGQKK